MKCREFVDFLMRYLDDDLDKKTKTIFEAHLQICPPCVGYLDGYKDVIELGKMACSNPDGPVPGDAPEALIKAILAARGAADAPGS
jgi:anti-sigma factor RsiW